MIHHIPSIYIAETETKGRGMFTAEDIPTGSTIETCPIILIPKIEVDAIHKTTLHDYYFTWQNDQAAIALGYGSLYNHSDSPNADFELDYDAQFIVFKAIEEIKSGMEITIDYHAGLKTRALWF